MSSKNDYCFGIIEIKSQKIRNLIPLYKNRNSDIKIESIYQLVFV